MKISYNIPSYKRPNKQYTLEKYPFFKVWVDSSEEEEYRKCNYGKEKQIIELPDGIQGNVARVRNYILENELKENDAVVICDDDIQYFGCYENNENYFYGYEENELEADEMDEFIENNSFIAQQLGFKMWGVRVNSDHLGYRHNRPYSNNVILGPFSCFLKGFNLKYDETLNLKEDYDIYLQNIMEYGGVLRNNKYFYRCLQSSNVGGCALQRNLKKEKEQFELLQKKWGKKLVYQDKKSIKTFDYNPKINL